jgi:site-specific recombinase XerD
VNASLRQVLSSREGTRNYAIVQVLLQTGMRLDECSQLILADLEVGERNACVTIRSGKAIGSAQCR